MEKVCINNQWWAFGIQRYFGCLATWVGGNATLLETMSGIKQLKLVLRTLQFISRINRIKQQQMALPIPLTLFWALTTDVG